jgi:HPt (histidine-containing phosphotransfer) domain-containing protein
MDGYVSKPIQAAELFEVIERTVPAPAAEQPAVNWERALESVAGDRELMRELASIFLATYPQWMSKLREALACRDSPALRRLAHTLKGSVAQFRADDVGRVAGRLETMGERGDLAGAAETLAALEGEMQRLQPALRAFVMTP